MVFGWQKPNKPARASTASYLAFTSTKPPPRRKSGIIPVPETIAEDGCEVVPQFFPGVIPTNVPTMALSSQKMLTIDTNVRDSQYNSARAPSQRRAGSIKAMSSAGSDGVGAEEKSRDYRGGPRSAPPHQSAHVPRRCSSNGSSISPASTFAINSISPQTQTQTQHTHASGVTLAVQRRHSGHQPQPQLHGRMQPNAQGAQSDESARNSDKGKPSTNRVHRRASAINFTLGSSVADGGSTKADAGSKHLPVTTAPFALADEDKPGSYANRRRRGSIHSVRSSIDGGDLSSGGSSTATSSTVTSPVLSNFARRNRIPATANHHRSYRQAHNTTCSLLSQLKRNNTTRTITQNDLLADTGPTVQDLRRSETYSRHHPILHSAAHILEYKKMAWLNMSDPSLYSVHTRYSQMSASPESPMALDFTENVRGEEEDQGIMTTSPYHGVSGRYNAAAASDSYQMIHFIGNVNDFDDDTDAASKIVPNVNTVGTQFAYLPPRSGRLSITN